MSRVVVSCCLIVFVSVLTTHATAALGCDETRVMPSDQRYVALHLSKLLGNVSESVRLVQYPATYAEIDDLGWFVMPAAQLVVGKGYVGSGGELDDLRANIVETLVRVGDLAAALLDGWSLGLLTYDSPYTYDPVAFAAIEPTLADGVPGIDFAQYGTAESEVATALELVRQTLNSVMPEGSFEPWSSYYVPGVGAFLEFRGETYTAPESLDECSEWTSHIGDALSRTGDLFFDVLPVDESLTICSGSLGIGLGPYYFVITGGTLGEPSTWEVYLSTS